MNETMSSAIEYTGEAQSELGEAGQDYGLPGSRKIEKGPLITAKQFHKL